MNYNSTNYTDELSQTLKLYHKHKIGLLKFSKIHIRKGG